MKESDDSFLRGLPYVNIFQAFDCVVTKCFWVNLSPGYEDAIQKFKSSYLNLEISVTQKIESVLEGGIYNLKKDLAMVIDFFKNGLSSMQYKHCTNWRSYNLKWYIVKLHSNLQTQLNFNWLE